MRSGAVILLADFLEFVFPHPTLPPNGDVVIREQGADGFARTFEVVGNPFDGLTTRIGCGDLFPGCFQTHLQSFVLHGCNG